MVREAISPDVTYALALVQDNGRFGWVLTPDARRIPGENLVIDANSVRFLLGPPPTHVRLVEPPVQEWEVRELQGAASHLVHIRPKPTDCRCVPT